MGVKFPKGDILITVRLFSGSIFRDAPALLFASGGNGAFERSLPFVSWVLYKRQPLREPFPFLPASRGRRDSLDSFFLPVGKTFITDIHWVSIKSLSLFFLSYTINQVKETFLPHSIIRAWKPLCCFQSRSSLFCSIILFIKDFMILGN